MLNPLVKKRKVIVRELVMVVGGKPKWIDRVVEEEYSSPQPEEETNMMAIEELRSEYPRPSLDELFRLAQDTEQEAEASESNAQGVQEDHRKLADLVTRQKEYLRLAAND